MLSRFEFWIVVCLLWLASVILMIGSARIRMLSAENIKLRETCGIAE